MRESSEPASVHRTARARYAPRMLQTRLLLVGVGAIGAALASMLAEWGFRRVTLVDPDEFSSADETGNAVLPHRRVQGAPRASRAKVVARRLRRTLCAKGLETQIRGIDGHCEELPGEDWLRADIVLCVADHPRVRHDAAMLAKRYRKPLIAGDFDTESGAWSVTFVGAHAAACPSCRLDNVPVFAAADMLGVNLGSATKPAARPTPTVAFAVAAAMVEALTEFATHRLPSTLAGVMKVNTRDAWRGGEALPIALRETLTANARCPHHDALHGPLGIEVFGRTLGKLLRSLDNAAPGAAFLMTAPLVVNTRDERHRLVRVMEPAWCVPNPPPHGRWPDAALGEPMRVLDELSLAAVRTNCLEALSASRVGLAAGSWATVVLADGRLTGAFVAKRRRQHGQPPGYFEAAFAGDVDALARALTVSANPNARDQGTHVLTLACAGGGACVQLLRAAGARLKARDKPQALNFALSAGHRDVAEWLLNQVAGMDVRKWGRAAMEGALASGDSQLVALLVAHGVRAEACEAGGVER